MARFQGIVKAVNAFDQAGIFVTQEAREALGDQFQYTSDILSMANLQTSLTLTKDFQH